MGIMRRWVNWLPAVIWMGIIFFLSSRQSVQVSEDSFVNFLFFKSLHVIEYCVLFVLLFRAVATRSMTHQLVLAFLLTVLFAISDEIHQTYVPTREGKFRDVIIDAGGALGGWIFVAYIIAKLPLKPRNLARRWLNIS